MSDGVLGSIVSVIPGIGPILGPLLDGLLGRPNAVRRRISFQMSNTITDRIDIAPSEDGKQILLYNDTGGTVAATFPSQNSYTGETVTIPRTSSGDLTEAIVNCSLHDVDDIQIALLPPNSKAANGNLVGIASSGVVPVNGKPMFLGSYIRVTCKLKENSTLNEGESGILTFEMPLKYRLSQVDALYVESSEGNLRYEVSNCIADQNHVVTVSIPASILISGKVIVSATCSAETLNANEFWEENNRKYDVQPITSRERAWLKTLEEVRR